MRKSILLKILLVLSGAIGIGIGGALLFVPVTFEASSGINLNGNVNLISELRALGGLLFSGGILILLGAFIPKLTYTSVALSSLVYLAVGLSRVLSIIVDGIPNNSLLNATIIEICIGLFSLIFLIKYRKKTTI